MLTVTILTILAVLISLALPPSKSSLVFSAIVMVANFMIPDLVPLLDEIIAVAAVIAKMRGVILDKGKRYAEYKANNVNEQKSIEKGENVNWTN